MGDITIDTDDDTEVVKEVQVDKYIILATATDLALAFSYYDRKEDEDLPVGAIQKAIKEGIITVDEIVDAFAKELKRKL